MKFIFHFFVFAVDKLNLINFFDCAMKPGMQYRQALNTGQVI